MLGEIEPMTATPRAVRLKVNAVSDRAEASLQESHLMFRMKQISELYSTRHYYYDRRRHRPVRDDH